MEKILIPQQERGIRTGLLSRRRRYEIVGGLPAEPVIFDGRVSYELNSASDGNRYFVRTTIDLGEPRVRNQVKRFNALWENARVLAPYRSQ